MLAAYQEYEYGHINVKGQNEKPFKPLGNKD